MDRYVVIGNPVSHSLSPAIHARFAELTQEPIEYSTLLLPVGKFAWGAQRFFEDGGRGANITLPFKANAFHWADSRTERAQIAEAANFLALRSGRIEADNTDGAGLVADLTRNLGFALQGRSVLLLGAGGAARGVLAPLLALGPRRLVIANRTVTRARELAERFRAHAPIEAVALTAIPEEDFALVLNATSTSVNEQTLDVPQRLFHAGGLAYDMAYGPLTRSFLARATASGMKASDGLGMLVEQAAESFYLWRGKRPDSAKVLAELRSRSA